MTDVKRLYRSRTDTMVGGVSAGLANYFGIDPVVVRLVWGISILSSLGGAFLFYLLFWFIIPREPEANFEGEL